MLQDPSTTAAPRSHVSDRLMYRVIIAVLLLIVALQEDQQAWKRLGPLRANKISRSASLEHYDTTETEQASNVNDTAQEHETNVELESIVDDTSMEEQANDFNDTAQEYETNVELESIVDDTSPEEQNGNSLSGWWPHDDWLRHCAEKQSQLPARPFPSVGFWEGYRLGDCIKMCTACGKGDTLAFEYKMRACNSDNPSYAIGGNFTVIEEVLSLRDGVVGFEKPADDELVIHLRLGDVIEGSKQDVATMLIEGGNPRHSKNFANAIKSVYEYLTDIHTAGVSKVKIVGGSHKPNYCEKSRPYAECIEESIRRAGYDVQMDLDGGNPDKDFYFLAHAKKIAVSAGGYSRLVGDIAVYKGGQAIGRTFPAGWSTPITAPTTSP